VTKCDRSARDRIDINIQIMVRGRERRLDSGNISKNVIPLKSKARKMIPRNVHVYFLSFLNFFDGASCIQKCRDAKGLFV